MAWPQRYGTAGTEITVRLTRREADELVSATITPRMATFDSKGSVGFALDGAVFKLRSAIDAASRA